MNNLKEGIYFVHIGNDNYAPTHSHFIRHGDKVHNPDGGPVMSFNDPPTDCNSNPNCTCTQNPDGTWKIICN